ncbi:hypothetical protein pb186bvf_004164 [Paramecium bursaria]
MKNCIKSMKQIYLQFQEIRFNFINKIILLLIQNGTTKVQLCISKTISDLKESLIIFYIESQSIINYKSLILDINKIYFIRIHILQTNSISLILNQNFRRVEQYLENQVLNQTYHYQAMKFYIIWIIVYSVNYMCCIFYYQTQLQENAVLIVPIANQYIEQIIVCSNINYFLHK